MNTPGRNDPCPCGSGRKYKKCCLATDSAPVADFLWRKLRRTEGNLIAMLMDYAAKHYGPDAIVEAWDEFSLWNEVPMDHESQPELDTAFIPWFLFNWIPDNAGVEEALHYPEKQVALRYLETGGAKLDAYTRRFIVEICSQPYSFFAVTDIEPGRRMTLKDLLLRREVTVHERLASAILSKGSIIYGRVITLDETSIMVGCAPIAIPATYLTEFIDIRENLERKFGAIDRDMLLEYDIETRSIYYDLREVLHDPAMPQLNNTDGDLLEFTTLHYTLQCTPREALEALASLSLNASADVLLREAEYDAQGGLASIEFPWLKKGNPQHAGWDNTVLGHIEIDGNRLTIEVNSRQRADAIKREVAHRLDRRAVFRNAVIRSTEKLLEDAARKRDAGGNEDVRRKSEELQALPEVQAQLRAMAQQHWKSWLDMSIPALKGQTPREASQSATGRERLEALLLQFEQYSKAPEPFQPDIPALRRTLGLD